MRVQTICTLRAHLKVIDEKKNEYNQGQIKRLVSLATNLLWYAHYFEFFFTYPAKHAFINTQISFNRSKRDEFQSTQRKGTIESYNIDAL